jgi:hypothetical protein
MFWSVGLVGLGRPVKSPAGKSEYGVNAKSAAMSDAKGAFGLIDRKIPCDFPAWEPGGAGFVR